MQIYLFQENRLLALQPNPTFYIACMSKFIHKGKAYHGIKSYHSFRPTIEIEGVINRNSRIQIHGQFLNISWIPVNNFYRF